MDGRVKTLHPRLYAGLLAVRSDPEHVAALAEHDIEEVDLVCVNLYPFESTAARRDVGEAEIVENIDIGGPTMIRAAAKNHAYAAVVTSPESYDAVLDELRTSGGLLSTPTRESLAAEAFAYTARYDTAIARWFAEKSEDFPPLHVRAYEKVTDLPYGENPHQRAAYYAQVGSRTHVLSQIQQHHGKQLSFNNLLDLDAARKIIARLLRARLRHRQAQQPVRRRARRQRAARLRARLRDRPAERLRRRHRLQPARRRGDRAAALRAVRRGAVRARLRGARAARSSRASRRSASSRTTSGAPR